MLENYGYVLFFFQKKRSVFMIIYDHQMDDHENHSPFGDHEINES